MGAQTSKKCSAEEAELERRIAEKIAQARESPHLRCNQMGLVAIPSLLQNSSGETELAVQQELLAKLRSADFQGNSLQHFPPLELPQLRDLNLWGNNMTNEMFEGLATAGEGGGGSGARKRGAAQKFRTMLRAKGDSKAKRKRASSYISTSPSSPSRTLHDSPVSEEEAATNGNGAALIGAFSHMPLLDSLDLSNNRLVYVPHTLAACTKLEQLSVEGNLLADPEEALAVLSSLVKLTMLNISLNRLTRIPGPVLKRGMLYTLLVRGNRILEVPAELSQLTCLQRLDLSDNCIDVVHAGAFAGLDRMKTLLLCHNKLEHLAEKSFNSLGSLTHLMLHHNEITLLPLSVSALTSLRVLDASFNAIGSVLPASLLGLQCLTELNLSSNSLRELPSEMSALVQLRKLTLCRNDLTALPLSLSALTDLMEVDLSWNQFRCGGYTVEASDEVGEGAKEEESLSGAEGLTVLWRIPSLEILSLASNELGSLPGNAFSALSSLRKLCLAANCLTNEGLPILAPVFEGEPGAGEESSETSSRPCALEWVGLTDNLLTSLPLRQLAPAKSSLLTLLLSSNPIETLSNGINAFTALEHFCITMPTWEGDESCGPLDTVTAAPADETVTEEETCKKKHTEKCEDEEKDEDAASPQASGTDSVEDKTEKEEESGKSLDGEGEIAAVAVVANGVESDEKEKGDRSAKREPLSSAKAIRSPRGRLSLEPIVPAKECAVCDIVPAKSFFPPDMDFGKGLDHLQRLYVGNHCSEALIAGGGDLWFDPSFLPALKHSDVATLNSFPWRGSSCELPGGLSSGRPCGWSAMTGTAPHPIEDRVCLASIRPLPGAEADLVAVFDGHGGGEVALYVQEHLPGALEKILRQALADHAQPCTVDDLDIQSLISSAFEATNAGLHQFLESEGKLSASVGCTAAVALFTRTSVYCANVGDSRTVLATLGFLDGSAALRASRGVTPAEPNMDASISPPRSRAATVDCEEEPKLKLSIHRASEVSPDRGELEAIRFGTGAGSVGSTPPVLVATRLSVDHKPGLRPEVARVRASGTFVAPDTSGNTYRLTGGDGVALAVSRAFGDFYLAPGVVVEPYTCQRPITRLDRFLVLGSDGIWDVLTDQEAIHAAATVLRRHPSNPQLGCMLAASHLRDMAFALSSHDDLSVVVVSVSAPKQ